MLTLHRYRAPAARVSQAVVDDTVRRLDLTRAALMAGAARRAADLTIAHVSEREQFGRPLAALATVKQDLARLVGEVDLVLTAVDLAAEDLDRGDDFALAVACTQAQASVTEINRIAHQLHGAIGFTELSPLRHAILRLWSWRDGWTVGGGTNSSATWPARPLGATSGRRSPACYTTKPSAPQAAACPRAMTFPTRPRSPGRHPQRRPAVSASRRHRLDCFVIDDVAVAA